MSEITDVAALLASIAAIRDGLGAKACRQAIARARIAVARTALDEAERAAGKRRGGTVVPFVKPLPVDPGGADRGA